MIKSDEQYDTELLQRLARLRQVHFVGTEAGTMTCTSVIRHHPFGQARLQAVIYHSQMLLSALHAELGRSSISQ